jgi:hypothetical protein
VTSLPQGPAGQNWGDAVVAAAARLASVLAPEQNLEPHWKRFGFVAILAPSAETKTSGPESLTFEILTRGGSRIVWGKAPGADALEPNIEQKLARLDYLLRFGALDGAQGPRRVDIRLFDGISLQPLNAARVR